MPSVSGDQQRFMGAALGRRVTGMPRATDPRMSVGRLKDFTRKVPGAPERAQRYGGGPVTENT